MDKLSSTYHPLSSTPTMYTAQTPHIDWIRLLIRYAEFYQSEATLARDLGRMLEVV